MQHHLDLVVTDLAIELLLLNLLYAVMISADAHAGLAQSVRHMALLSTSRRL